MAAATSTVPITKCPPGAAQNAVLDEYVYEKATQRFPVSTSYRGGGEFDSTGLDFSDYARCGTHSHKLASSRKLPAPEWVFQPAALRAVIVRQMEARAGFDGPKPGTDVERLRRAQDRIEKRIPNLEEDLTRNCKRLVALKADAQCDAVAVRKLAVAIEGQDSFLLLARKPDRGAGALARIATLYFSGLDSVAVADEVGMKPPAVRAQIWRMRQMWEKMQDEAPVGWQPSIRINLLKRMPAPAVQVSHRARIIKHCRMCGAECPKGVSKFCAKQCRIKWNNAKFIARTRVHHACVNCAGPLPLHAKKYCANCRSSQFVSLFERARALMRNPERTHCKHGHPICEANAHVGDLKRTGRYSCNQCWQASNARWKARHAAALQRIRNAPLPGA